MRYDHPIIIETSVATDLIMNHDHTTGNKNSSGCTDSTTSLSSNGAYEVDE